MTCMCSCCPLPSDQSFYGQISSHRKGVGDCSIAMLMMKEGHGPTIVASTYLVCIQPRFSYTPNKFL